MTSKLIKLSRKLHTKLHKGKKRTNSSARWIARHVNDQYVESSKKLGYRSRAAFKLIEINDHFKIFKPNNKILDLGAAPGSWSQVASAFSKKIIAVDLIECDPLEDIEFIQGDIYQDETIAKILGLAQGKFDVIMSDMAPNTSGHNATDHLRIMALVEHALELVKELLKKDGHFITKIFQGNDENEFLLGLKKYFAEVKRFKPDASRKQSSEIYLIAKHYLHD